MVAGQELERHKRQSAARLQRLNEATHVRTRVASFTSSLQQRDIDTLAASFIIIIRHLLLAFSSFPVVVGSS